MKGEMHSSLRKRLRRERSAKRSKTEMEAFAHARDRALERYGVKLSYADWVLCKRDIRSGGEAARKVCVEKDGTQSVWVITGRFPTPVMVTYCHLRDWVTTFLPPKGRNRVLLRNGCVVELTGDGSEKLRGPNAGRSP